MSRARRRGQCWAPQMAKAWRARPQSSQGRPHLGLRELTGKARDSSMEGAPPGLQGRGAGALVTERDGWAEGEEVARPRYMASSPRDPR
jgi:hypothetical protein